MADEFDFKEQAKALLKRLGQNPGAPLNQGLALAAVEAALREAYARGRGDAKAGKGGAPGALGRAASPLRPAGVAAKVSPPSASPDLREPGSGCAHEWEEAFLDGRSVGAKCVHCGILQREVQERCEHFYVQVGAGEICVACRKPKPPARK
ncbi:MAG: hypothetical protein NDJ90_03600 [Oligoflexia bacterium]|nr:hypothetical protein [Oligoflexia bacterium]